MIASITPRKLNNFKNWLTGQGSELLQTSNEYEVIRFKCSLGTGVIYKGKRGYAVNTQFVYDAFDCFLTQKEWRGKGEPAKRMGKGARRKRIQVLSRDGNECFYCGKPMENNDMTLEHVLSIVQGGQDRLENIVLAHKDCNEKAGRLPVIEKVKLRDQMRGYQWKT